jgi:hypothetical protein
MTFLCSYTTLWHFRCFFVPAAGLRESYARPEMNWGGAEAAISTGDFPNSLLYLSVTINIRAPL